MSICSTNSHANYETQSFVKRKNPDKLACLTYKTSFVFFNLYDIAYLLFANIVRGRFAE
jgi:hypothetical protein